MIEMQEQVIGLPKRSRIHIVSSRATCVGHQYRVADDLKTEVVTVTESGYIGCTCDGDALFLECEHIGIVRVRREQYLEAGKNRELMHTLFDVSNEEMKRCIYA